MDWRIFSISALVANALFWGLICFTYRKPQRAGRLLSCIVTTFSKIYICSICALTAVLYSLGYIEICSDKEINEAVLNIIMIVLMIIYGIALSFFAKAWDVRSDDKEMCAVITLNVSIAIFCIIDFFWRYKIYSVATFFIALLIGRYFWLDNVNLKNAVDNIKMIVTALKRQGIMVSLIYFVVLKCLFRMDIGDSILYKAIQVIALGSSTVIFSSITLCLGYWLWRKGFNQNKLSDEVEVDNSISKGSPKSKK